MTLKSIIFSELPAHDTCWSITTGRDGNIYVGLCGEHTGGLSVFIIRYNPITDVTDYMLEVAPALNEPLDNGRAPICKIHYCLLPASNGKLYCATHYSGPPSGHALWRPWNTWDDPEHMASGFHIFSYDPKTEIVDDFGIMSPNEGSRAMAFAEKRGLLYGITWPRDHFYVFDVNNRKYKDCGRIGEVNAQVVWVDPNENGYTVDDLGYIVKYDADAQKLIHLPAKVPIDSSMESEQRTVYDLTPSPDGKSVYGVVWNLETIPFNERLFRFDYADNTIHDYGYAFGNEKLNHIGGLIFGDDGYLYYAASKREPERRLPYRMYLFRMDVATGKKEEICAFDDGKWHSEYIAKATKDFAGNLYFADTNNRPERIYVYTPDGCGKNFKERWPIVRSWG